MGSIRNRPLIFVLWLITLCLVAATLQMSFKNVHSRFLNDLLTHVDVSQSLLNRNLDKLSDHLKELGGKLSRDVSTPLPSSLQIYRFDSQQNLKAVYGEGLDLLPSTQKIDDAFLLSSITSSDIWLTVNALNQARPEIFFLTHREGDVDLFRFSQLEPFTASLLGDQPQDLVFIYRNGMKNSTYISDNTPLPSSMIDSVMSGEKSLAIYYGWLGLTGYGYYYNPQLQLGFVIPSTINYPLWLDALAILALMVLIGGMVFFINSRSAAALAVSLAALCLSAALGIEVYRERATNVREYREQLLFKLQGTVILVNKMLDQATNTLQATMTARYRLKQTDDQIKQQWLNSSVLAIAYYDQFDGHNFQKIEVLSPLSWQPPKLLPEALTSMTACIGPIRDPVLGSIFILSNPSGNQERSVTAIAISAEDISNNLRVFIETFHQPLLVNDFSNKGIYESGSLPSHNRIRYQIPSVGWELISTADGLKTPFNFHSLHATFLLSTLFFLMAMTGYFYTRGSFEAPLISIDAVLVTLSALMVTFIVLSGLILNLRSSAMGLSQIKNVDQLKNFIASTTENYRLQTNQDLKTMTIELDLKYLERKEIYLLLAKGTFSTAEKLVTGINSWTASPSTFDGSATSPSYYSFDADIIDSSNFTNFPFNPIILRIPVSTNSKEPILFIPSFDNLSTLQDAIASKLPVLKSGCNYVQDAETGLPMLEYVFILDRGIINPLLAFIAPLLVVLIILQQGIIDKKTGSFNLAIWVSVIFATTLLHQNYRRFIHDLPLTYLENIFLGSFLFILIVLTLFLTKRFNESEQGVLMQRKVYWPIWLLIMTLLSYTALVR
jgi:hypothetical protein